MANELLSRAKFSRGDSDLLPSYGTDTFTEIINVTSLGGPEQTKDELEVTHLQSTGKEFLAGMSDGGSVNFEVNYDYSNAAHVDLRDDAQTSLKRNWQIEFENQVPAVVETAQFQGELMEFSRSNDPNTPFKYSGRVKISGDITWS
jgi:hypothetical protein